MAASLALACLVPAEGECPADLLLWSTVHRDISARQYCQHGRVKLFYFNSSCHG
jgi:hypothetical protein